MWRRLGAVVRCVVVGPRQRQRRHGRYGWRRHAAPRWRRTPATACVALPMTPPSLRRALRALCDAVAVLSASSVRDAVDDAVRCVHARPDALAEREREREEKRREEKRGEEKRREERREEKREEKREERREEKSHADRAVSTAKPTPTASVCAVARRRSGAGPTVNGGAQAASQAPRPLRGSGRRGTGACPRGQSPWSPCHGQRPRQRRTVALWGVDVARSTAARQPAANGGCTGPTQAPRPLPGSARRGTGGPGVKAKDRSNVGTRDPVWLARQPLATRLRRRGGSKVAHLQGAAQR